MMQRISKTTCFSLLSTSQVDILQAKDCEIVVIGYHRNQERGNFWSYSPKGSLGEKFLQHDFGDYVLQLFHEYIKGKGKLQEIEHSVTASLIIFFSEHCFTKIE